MRSIVALLLLVTVSFQAKAYDIDTHFYATYAMARHAGIKHEVAAKIALSAQWMDESFISDPMSLMFLGLSGVKKRRLLHFPANRYVGKFNGLIEQKAFGVSMFGELPDAMKAAAAVVMAKVGFDPKNLDRMTVFSETEKDHRLATQLLMMGLKNGDLMQTAASLHVLEDSYAHAGTPAGEGHRGAWHWPDRPYSNPTKYFQMTESVFQALAAIRLMLPESALDCDLRTTRLGNANCTTNAQELQTSWVQKLAVQEAVNYNPLVDEKYVRGSLKSVFKIAAHKKIGYVSMTHAQIEKLIDDAKIQSGETVSEALVGIVTDLTKRYMGGDPSLNVKHMITDVFQLDDPSDDDIRIFIRNYGIEDDHGHLSGYETPAFQKFALSLSRGLMRTYVPRELNNDDHRNEVELDSDIELVKGKVIRSPRNIEMDLRIAKMQELIKKLYGKDIEMIENHTKDDVGFAHEIWLREDAKPKFPANPKPGFEYITFSLEEKHRWDLMVFHYLFPSMKDEDLLVMVDVGAILKNITDNATGALKTVTEGKPSWVPAPIEATGQIMTNSLEVNHAATLVEPFAVKWLTDLTTEPKTTFNYNYHSVNFLEEYKQNGQLRAFFSDKDTWNEKLAVNLQTESKKRVTSIEQK